MFSKGPRSLFLLYIYDLPSSIESSFVADDTKIDLLCQVDQESDTAQWWEVETTGYFVLEGEVFDEQGLSDGKVTPCINIRISGYFFYTTPPKLPY